MILANPNSKKQNAVTSCFNQPELVITIQKYWNILKPSQNQPHNGPKTQKFSIAEPLAMSYIPSGPSGPVGSHRLALINVPKI